MSSADLPPPLSPHLPAACQSCRNTVPVPLHWSQKRKFLQGKRGIEKPIFQLPDFIEATGISEMRQAYQVHLRTGHCARTPPPPLANTHTTNRTQASV